MEQKFRIDRHISKYDQQSKLLNRTMFFALLIGLALPWKYLSRFAENSVQIYDANEAIMKLNAEQKKISEEKASLDNVGSALNKAQETLKEQPWIRQAEALRHAFVELSNRGNQWPSDRQVFQNAADETVRTVAADAQNRIIPLLELARDKGKDNRTVSEKFTNLPTDFRTVIKDWEDKHIGQNWYETVSDKEVNIKKLTESLREELSTVVEIIDTTKEQIDNKRNALSSREVVLKKDSVSKENDLSTLNSEMQEVLPSWLKGLISIDQMIQLYPIAIPVLIVFALIMGISLSRHYEFFVKNLDLSDADRTDASISSMWTLTSRGLRGTLTTLATYLVVLLFMYVFFEWGCSLLLKWISVTTQPAWIMNKERVIILGWAGRITFFVAGILVILRLLFANRLIRQN